MSGANKKLRTADAWSSYARRIRISKPSSAIFF
jgi:hypothetical protein